MAVQIITQNVNRLNNSVKKKRMYAHLSKLSPDILMLQETHFKSKVDFIFNPKQFPLQLQASGTSKSRGVAILISSRVRFTLSIILADKNGKFLFANGCLEGREVTLATLYVPNENQLSCLEDVLLKIQNFSTGEIVLGGDLNLIVDTTMDKMHGSSSGLMPTKSAQAFTLADLFTKFNLLDIW